MQPIRARRLAPAAALLIACALGAAPATPSYQGVLKALDALEQSLQAQAPEGSPNAASWRGFASRLREDLQAYGAATDVNARFEALRRIARKADELRLYGWAPAAEVRVELDAWIQPRSALAWAEYRLLEAIKLAPAGADENRAQWQAFVRERLRPALIGLESAGTVAARLDAMDRVEAELAALRRTNHAAPWTRSLELQSALDGMFNFPNLQVTVDQSTVANAVARQGIVEAGWIYFNGQWSYVNPGPIVGVGFVPTADGIQVAISQALNSTTPVQGFQDQVAADRQGRLAARLYQFDATTYNNAVLTTNVLFRLATGVQVAPGYNHGISAAIQSLPQPGRGLGRGLASLVGFNQRRITNEVHENALPEIQRQVVESSAQLAGIKATEQTAQINAQIRPFVVDGQTVATGPFGVAGLRLQTLPQFAMISGTVDYFDGSQVKGAGFPKPRAFQTVQAGVTVDVNLPSVVSNLIDGLLQQPQVQAVDNVMVVAPAAAGEGAPSPEDVQVRTNVDFATYLAEVRRSREAGETTQAIRATRPRGQIRVASDAAGNLVVLVPELTIEVPAPPAAARGGGLTGPPAQVYRLVFQRAELAVKFELQPNPFGGAPRLVGQVAGFDGGPNVQVFAINEDEASAVALNAFTARAVVAVFGNRIAALPINQELAPLATLPIAVMQPSTLDPTGWMRLVVQPR